MILHGQHTVLSMIAIYSYIELLASSHQYDSHVHRTLSFSIVKLKESSKPNSVESNKKKIGELSNLSKS